MKHLTRLIIPLLFVTLATGLSIADSSLDTPRNVLLLLSYEHKMPWQQLVTEHILSAIEILSGKAPGDIPAVVGTNAYMFDWRQLQRWQIREEHLPRGSILRYKTPSFFELYGTYIIVAAVLIAIQTLLIAALLFNRTKYLKTQQALPKSHEMLESRVEKRTQKLKDKIHERKRAERQLKESESFLTTILDAIQDGIMVLDPDLNIINANQTMKTLYAEQCPMGGKSATRSTLEGTRCVTPAPQHLYCNPERGPKKRCPFPNSTKKTAWRNRLFSPFWTDREKSSPWSNICAASRRAREALISQLQKAFSGIKTLQGFIPICASYKKIRDDKGYWNQIESYIQTHSNAQFSHGICQDCAEKLYPGFGASKKS